MFLSLPHKCELRRDEVLSEFRIQKDTTMEKSIPYIIDPVESQDIDNESDWLLAEMKYRFLTEQGLLK